MVEKKGEYMLQKKVTRNVKVKSDGRKADGGANPLLPLGDKGCAPRGK